MASNLVPIPQPPALPFVGNMTSLDPETPVKSFLNLADQYGEIFQLELGGKKRVFLTSWELVNEACDEKRFRKLVSGALEQVRNGVGDGLFTAYTTEEPNWQIAHRILMPAFGPMTMMGMFDEMHDVASQLCMKWARYGQDEPISVTEDLTRLTLDTLALCTMGYRFNSYYTENLHPFLASLGDFLRESGSRSQRPGFAQFFYRQAEQKYWSDIKVMRDIADEVLRDRKEHPNDRKDLLNAMLNGRDPKTGQGLPDSLITDNLITFLIAGHETTTGMLSFTLWNLLKHPEAYRKVQAEVDEVLGKGAMTVEQVSKFKYIPAVLRETLRLSAPITAIGVTPREDTVLCGKYEVKKDQPLVLLMAKSHLDPAVYGDDAKEFKPERMLDENFNRLQHEFPNSWKPFGNGARACIGRPFAWQEAVALIALLFQNFNFVADPNYTLKIKQTLTIKPDQFQMRAILRDGLTPTTLEHRLQGTTPTKVASKELPVGSAGGATATESSISKGKAFSIFYGSNTGTCEALANRLAQDAGAHGWHATRVDALDTANQALGPDPCVLICASYEGLPADNAGLFVNWLENLKANELEGSNFAIFGCGHHDWAQTFHRIPKLLDSVMNERGGKRICEMGLTDVASGDMFTDFETWEDKTFWPALHSLYGSTSASSTLDSGLSVEISTPRTGILRQDVREATVVATHLLTPSSSPAPKRHIEIQLPSDATYTAGDYLAVLPLNPPASVQRAMQRFHIPWDAHLTIAGAAGTLPTTPTSAVDVLSAYVELAQPATRRNIAALAEGCADASSKAALEALGDADYAAEISAKRVSVLDLLARYPAVELPLARFLAMLPPMRVRTYSISSSPLWDPHRVTLSLSVLDEDALSGQGRHLGVGSNYLDHLQAGDRLHVAVRPSGTAFHLPTDAEKTPVLMVAAGSGIAPFRGFVQERAAQVASGRNVARGVLWFGCRAEAEDDLYRAELDRWEKMGAVEVRRAFSREPEKSEGCKYVQERFYADREMVTQLWQEGAKVFVCGSGKVGEGVREASLKMVEAWVEKKEVSETGASTMTRERAEKWFDSIKNERFATDVFA